MIFTNHRSYVPSSSQPTPQKSAKQMNFTHSLKSSRVNTAGALLSVHVPASVHVPTRVQIVKSVPYVEKVETAHQRKKIRWGEPFWNLFHVLAEKVNETDFYLIRAELLNTIYTICSNLPCPDCTNHAVHYLNGINFNTIRTKEDLKTMLYNFHNAVNARKGYAIYPRDQLESKYEKGCLIPTIELFLYHFRQRHFSVRMIADDMHRQRLSKNLTSWFQTNLKYFHP